MNEYNREIYRREQAGQPVRKRPPVRYDENGRPIQPRKRPPVQYETYENVNRRRMRTEETWDYERVRSERRHDADRHHDADRRHNADRHLKKKKRNRLGKLFLWLQALLSIAFMVLVLLLNLLPAMYVILIGVILFIMWVFTALSQRSQTGRGLGKVYSMIVIAILSIGVTYIAKANHVMDQLTAGHFVKMSEISVVVLENSWMQQLQDLDGHVLGIQSTMDRTNTDLALQDVRQTCSQGVISVSYDGWNAQAAALYDGNVDAILMNEAYRSLIRDIYPNFDSETRVIHTFSYQEQISQNLAEGNVDVVEEPFTVYLSGNDSYGTVTLADGRSDVNILATVNPKTKQILLTTTPRDYYVELPFGEDCWDKMTHTGLFGIDCSIETLERLYDIDIDYYVRLNFSGFQGIVDALGGIEVYSDYSFYSLGGFYYESGYNYMNGEEALNFVRERYAFEEGDVQRGRNQMEVIRAIVDKAASPAILTGYMDLMDTISGCFITNMPRDKISDLVKMQLKDGAEWNIVSNSVAGHENERTTYLSSGDVLSVMDPDEEAIQQAHDLIQRCENGEILSNAAGLAE